MHGLPCLSTFSHISEKQMTTLENVTIPPCLEYVSIVRSGRLDGGTGVPDVRVPLISLGWVLSAIVSTTHRATHVTKSSKAIFPILRPTARRIIACSMLVWHRHATPQNSKGSTLPAREPFFIFAFSRLRSRNTSCSRLWFAESIWLTLLYTWLYSPICFSRYYQKSVLEEYTLHTPAYNTRLCSTGSCLRTASAARP